jgi:serine/threonine protein kinase
MQAADDHNTTRPKGHWEATVHLAAGQATARTSITAGRPAADPSMVRRVLQRARVATARPDGADCADYVLGDLIGSGGMGLVYAGTQLSLERPVAVKVLRPELLTDARARDSFFEEAFVTADLDHPNTVPVYEIGLTDAGAPFYAMKVVRGVKWSTTLAANALAQNLHVLLMVSDVVAFAHGKGVIHRDLKPENVMLGPYGEVLLMDWGLAASIGNPRAQRVTAETLCSGTPAYMPPEVAGYALDRIGTASDVYLLGGILYEIVTGLTPHGGEDLMECIRAAERNELQPTNNAGELMDIALRALRTDPAERHASVKDFAAEIRTALTHIDSFSFYDQGRGRFENLPGLDRDELYRECHEIIALYQRALAHWPGNVRAAEGLVRARSTLATVALRRGEIELARSQVRALEQECERYNLRTLGADAAAEAIRDSLAERDRRGRKLAGRT